MRKTIFLFVMIFLLISSLTFAISTKPTTAKKTTAKKTVAKQEEQWIINTGLGSLGIGGEYVIKKSQLLYGGGVFMCSDEDSRYYNYWNGHYYNDHYDTDLFEVGAYGIIGMPFKGTKFTGQLKIGLVSRTWNNDYLDYSDTEIDSVFGLGFGYKINNNYEVYVEGNSPRGLVLGIGFKI